MSARARTAGAHGLLLAGCLLVVSLWAALADADDVHQSSKIAADAEEEVTQHGAHAARHGHAPAWSDINWFHGFISEREGPPSLLFRPPGMPVPVGALLLNTAVLFFLLGRFGGPAISQGLLARKQRIAGAIQAAARMKEEATEQLGHFEQKLADMAAEMDRIMVDTRAQAKAEQERMVGEATARQEALEKDARRLVEQEIENARQLAIASLLSRAVEAARTQIASELGETDHERMGRALVLAVEAQLSGTEARS